MRPTCSLYIDVGYLRAGAAVRATGTSLGSGIHIEYAPLIRGLIETAEAQSGMPILRVHWYDAAKDRIPTVQQQRIGQLSKVKLRLGRFGREDKQKGVDLRLGLDLVSNARNRTSNVFFLLSGDDDLTEAVEEAQALGIQLTVLAMPTSSGSPYGVSAHLIQAADDFDILDADFLDSVVFKRDPTPQPAPAPPAPQEASSPPATVKAKIPAALIPEPAAAADPPAPSAAPRRAILAYSTATGDTTGDYSSDFVDDTDDGIPDAVIDDVISRVLASFRTSATAQELRNLSQSRPHIFPFIDSAMLLDLSHEAGIYDLSDTSRRRLRRRFWELHDSN